MLAMASVFRTWLSVTVIRNTDQCFLRQFPDAAYVDEHYKLMDAHTTTYRSAFKIRFLVHKKAWYLETQMNSRRLATHITWQIT
jgi:hypothetical protein